MNSSGHKKKRRTTGKLFLTAAILLLVLLVAVVLSSGGWPGFNFFAGDKANDSNPGDSPETIPGPAPEPPPPPPDIRKAFIVAAGDIIIHRIQIEQAYAGDDRYDFSPSFQAIAPRLRAADLAVANFETTMAGPERGYSGYPCFNAPADLAFNLKEAGFDLMCTANNHSLDSGLTGLEKTLKNLQSAGLQTFGTYAEPAERETPLLVDVNGIQIAFLAYTYSTNGIPVPAGYEYAINYIPFFDFGSGAYNFELVNPVYDDIAAAREAGADLVAVYMHWGREYWHTPDEEQRDLARRLAEAGADLILGNHPHVIQPMEWLQIDRNGKSRRALVTYAMGNFISNQHYSPGPPNYIPTPAVQYGMLLDIEITKDMDQGETIISDATYELTWVHRNQRHCIFPCSNLLAGGASEHNLTGSEFDQVESVYREMIEVVERFGFE